jgi:hypothetical protein
MIDDWLLPHAEDSDLDGGGAVHGHTCPSALSSSTDSLFLTSCHAIPGNFARALTPPRTETWLWN